MFNRSLLLASLALIVAAASAAPPQSRFRIKDTWRLGGDGSWDYMTVDAPKHLLFIARLTRVMVVDTSTGKLVSEIGGLQHAHGIALSNDGKLGYISDGGAAKVVVFDRSDYKVIAAVPTGKNPDAVLLDPSNHRLFAFNGASNSMTVIDTTNNSVSSTVPMPGKPEFSVTDGVGSIFVNIEDTSQVLRIDAVSLKITASWSLAPCKAPSGLAIDTTHHRLFAVCDNDQMAVVDSTSGTHVATVRIGAGSDAVAYDASRSLVFSSNGESGTLSIIQQRSPDSYALFQTLPTQVGARTLALDPSSADVYTVSAKFGPKPPASSTNPKGRPPVLPDSFNILAISR